MRTGPRVAAPAWKAARVLVCGENTPLSSLQPFLLRPVQLQPSVLAAHPRRRRRLGCHPCRLLGRTPLPAPLMRVCTGTPSAQRRRQITGWRGATPCAAGSSDRQHGRPPPQAVAAAAATATRTHSGMARPCRLLWGFPQPAGGQHEQLLSRQVTPPTTTLARRSAEVGRLTQTQAGRPMPPRLS